MTNMKRIRDSLGHTHQNQKTNSAAWYALAQSFHSAAEILDEFRNRIPSDTRPFALNAAVSLELIFKAILAKKNRQIPDGPKGHNLQFLCKMAQVAVTENQKATLELLTEEIIWAARYPVPKNEDKWDDYHDRVVEKHIVRTKQGNVFSVVANKDTFPDMQNYTKIWHACAAEFISTH